MRVQANIHFYCATTGRSLETQLSTEARNLVMFRQGKVPMHCAFCGRRHYWSLVKYQRPVAKHEPRLPSGSLRNGENYLGTR
jgi:hypothetical protein